MLAEIEHFVKQVGDNKGANSGNAWILIADISV